MDVGVGSFVFSQGLVSAIPFISQPYYLLEPTTTKLIKTIRKSIPIFLLGFIRVLLVKGADYPVRTFSFLPSSPPLSTSSQEHITEYGVHWNFFLTLGFIPIFQVLLHPLLSRFPIPLIPFSLSLIHQFLLSTYLSPLILTPSTTPINKQSLILQNKEGLISLLGYLSIHIYGLALGTIVLPSSPSFFRKHQVAIEVYKRTGNKPVYFDAGVEVGYRRTSKTVQEVFSYAIIWWVLFGVVGWVGGDEVSRRMVCPSLSLSLSGR
jgi:phosphatidylinositol glycan class W